LEVAGSGSKAETSTSSEHRGRRSRGRGGFRVVSQADEKGEEVYVVVGPTGVALYTFTDIREAIAEAAELNS
jgi:hypothetical protein